VGAFAVDTPGGRIDGIRLRPLGGFQRENFALALAATEALLTDLGRGPLDARAVRDTAARLTLPGRMELVGADPVVIWDGAHNPSGARALSASLLEATGGRRPVAVVSILDDKDAAGILAALVPVTAGAVFTRCSRRDALPPATLGSLWGQLGGAAAEVVATPGEALERAVARAGPGGAVLVTGSLYLLSQLVRERSVAGRRNAR
jgi:dihydrofolate synthase/folylpolyglutamate synthase